MDGYVEKRMNCARLDALTRSIFDLAPTTNIGELENRLVGIPKARRGSAALSETTFFDLVNTLSIADIFEIGGNDSHHTQKFLQNTSARIHTFEPNIYAIKFYTNLVGNPRLHFNSFGLSDKNSVSSFNILTELNGKKLDPINGYSSFSYIHDRNTATYRSVAAMTARAEDYIAIQTIDLNDIALWIDVEGFAVPAVEGFGPELRKAIICLCEVEMTDMLTTGANADNVISLLECNGMDIVYRDFQNYGQCNILAVRRTSIPDIQAVLERNLRKFLHDVKEMTHS